MFFFGVKVANYKVKETPTVTGRCSVIGRRCWRSTLWLPRRTGVVSLGKGGKLQGKGDANRHGKVFSDIEQGLYKYKADFSVDLQQRRPITEHLPVTVGVSFTL